MASTPRKKKEAGMHAFLTRYSDIGLAALVIGIIGMMIVPLPTPLLDLLLTLNITISVTLLMVSLYIPSALQISAFPSILLITTLFRLALNVSSTRLILLQADAGEVIESFGNFVVQGNYVVGAVIFLILTLIQFLVIAKGAERVSEVGARFTLDAMPGKQMSIDADLRAGAFDLNEARRRRALVQKESQLYGAMDGAMKFVKGDAIAGIIMTAINILAGIIIGVMQRDMAAGDAAQVYTLLTIGDGLVSQIPALLIATTAGIIVTRVASEEEDASHLGSDIFGQLLAQPKALAITSALLFILGGIPGLPTVPFMFMGTIVGGIAYGLFKSAREAQSSLSVQEEEQVEQVEGQAKEGARQARAMIPAVTPLTLDVGTALSAAIRGEREAWFHDTIPTMREGLFFELGVKIPGMRVRTESMACGPKECCISLDEVPVHTATVWPGEVLINESAQGLSVFGVEGREVKHPVTGEKACWVEKEHRGLLEDAGYTSWDEAAVMMLECVASLKKHASDFVGMQQVQLMLNQLEGPYPAMVREVVPKLLSLQEFTDVVYRLSQEGISLRLMPKILEILAERAKSTKDPLYLVEDVRAGLSRYITHKYAGPQGDLVVYLLDREIEEMVSSSVKVSDGVTYLAMPPEITREILDAIGKEVAPDTRAGKTPILLTDQKVRRYIKKLASLEVPEVVVLSYQEIDPALKVQPLGRITVRHGA